MINFLEYKRRDLLESKNDKNLHLDHIEEEIFNGGVNGTRGAINFLRSLRDMLSGKEASPKINLTTKFDGAPAVVCGIDPASGRFFVGTKGVFAKTPKLNFTNSDIDKNHSSPGLNEKLKIALKYLPELGIKGVLQGDMMFTKSDLSIENIDGQKSWVFQPNTITYAVPTDSSIGKTIGKSQMGIVFHTTYTGGPTISDMRASFGANTRKLRPSRNVWYDDASFIDATGAAQLSSSQTEKINKILTESGQLFQKIPASFLNFVSENESYSTLIKIWNNKLVRSGQHIGNVVNHTDGLIKFIEERKIDEISKLKTDSAKKKREQEYKIILGWFKRNRSNLINSFQLMNLLVEAKIIILRQLEKVRSIGTFMKTNDGYKVTAPEGFVAIQSDRAVKLVDRLQFSFNNFTVQKNW